MWAWIQQHSTTLSFFTGLGTLSIWLMFAQLFWLGFKRQRRARIVISQGWGEQWDSVCLLANMSYEPIFVQHIMLTLCINDTEYHSAITNFEEVQPYDSENRPEEVTRQGPMHTGSLMKLGTFRELIQRGAKHIGLTDQDYIPIDELQPTSCKVTVIANYGPSGKVIGAQREFQIEGENHELLRPLSLATQRMETRAARKRMRAWLESET